MIIMCNCSINKYVKTYIIRYFLVLYILYVTTIPYKHYYCQKNVLSTTISKHLIFTDNF